MMKGFFAGLIIGLLCGWVWGFLQAIIMVSAADREQTQALIRECEADLVRTQHCEVIVTREAIIATQGEE